MNIIFMLAAYLAGAFPTGYLVYRWTEKGDIRKVGSGNTGFTNMLRIKGWRWAVPVLVIDVVKGYVPPFLILLFDGDPLVAAASGISAVVGHMFPVYIGFRGGKGVATAMGAFAALALAPAAISLALFLIFSGITRYVSVGSMAAVLMFPLIARLAGHDRIFSIAGGVIAVLVVLKHIDNVRRLIRGEERRVGKAKP